MRPPLTRPALVLHAFFPARQVIGSRSSHARDAVDAVWGWASENGYTEKVGGWDTDLTFPEELSEHHSLKVLAARARPTPGGSRELLVYQVHDVLVVSSVHAFHSRLRNWPQFDDQWLTHLEGLGEEHLIGAARVYCSVVGGRLERAGGLADGLTNRRPAVRPGLAWRPTDKMLVYELARSGLAAPRRLLAVAKEEPTLDEWLWTSPGSGLPSFTRYLLQAARLRNLSVVLRTLRPGFRETVRRVEEQCRAVETVIGDRGVPLEQILAAERGLVRLNIDQGGLVEQLTTLRSMIRSVEAIQHNLETVGATGRVGAADSRIGRWALEQLRTEDAYLSAAQVKAAEQGRLATAVVTTRLADRKANLTLLQTTIIGAVLMTLATIQSLEYEVPLPGRLQPPTIFLLTGLALVLPSAVLRWPRGAAYDATWARIDVGFAAVIGAGAGWFCTSLVSWATDAFRFHWQGSVALTVGFAAVGAGLGGWIADRRRKKLKIEADQHDARAEVNLTVPG
ncbi:CATRA conflict system CASPASE/TPR repeat-associated protein [Actinoplanes auranticolor]|uniref:Uncharacterized protein n=1 Tax=Actinoplanes auranticolor TaxID=47988 RepID=A0A919SPV9_9ACTN|nr:CATRA conflict system CASPASE/TPR repeat-associated protein [Actinoplanes auranticolor]GIM76342.1 hypothetical protein Aau02nite_70430 [Actinoplanes auranticolor]